MLGVDAPQHPVDALRAALCRLAAQDPERRTALILEGLDRADADTARFAIDIASGHSWPVPVVLAVHDADGPAGRAIAAALPDPGAVHTAPSPSPETLPDAWSTLPPRARRVIQALAVADGPVPVQMLGELLSLSPLRVLEELQAAVDVGVPVHDLDGGVVELAAGAAAQVRGALLPSLARAWRASMVELLDPASEPVPTAPTTAEPAPAPTIAAPMAPAPAPEAAAAHLRALGAELEAAARLARAAQEALDHDAPHQARQLVHRGVAAIAELPESRPRALLLAELLDLGAAAVHLQAGAGAADLPAALSLADRAWAALPPDAPATLGARLRARAAAICYDRADEGSLERALSELTEAIRELRAAGESRAAARLLNDQAAIWVRLGDPVRAAGLLDQSREVFSSLPDPTRADEIEVAETLHLLARLPLHVEAREGQAGLALEAALDHARDARRIYERLADARAAARVQETMGRLATLAGQTTDALAWLAAAAREQQAHGDALGLARTTAALAEAIGKEGDAEEALELLATSMALNHRVGSGGGLRINRTALERLPADHPAVPRLQETATRLLVDLEGAGS
jgi:tetratricopeptide (TPR) repeat protein